MSERSSGQKREEQRIRTFNPNDHLMQLKSRDGSKDYLPVQWRIVWFRELCPEGIIETEEVEVDLDREMEEEAYVWNPEKRKSEKVIKRAKGYARFKATVTDGRGGKATGTKSECAASFGDYIEKAETGAIGRALACLGYGTAFAPELNEDHRIVDTPVDRPQAANNNKGNITALPVKQPDLAADHSEEDKAMLATLHGGIKPDKWAAFKVNALGSAILDSRLSHNHIVKLMAEFEKLVQNK